MNQGKDCWKMSWADEWGCGNDQGVGQMVGLGNSAQRESGQVACWIGQTIGGGLVGHIVTDHQANIWIWEIQTQTSARDNIVGRWWHVHKEIEY